MKRDMDLIRKLLFHFEERESFAMEKQPTIKGYSDDTIQYHLLLLAQADLIVFEASRSTTSNRIIQVFPFAPTWKGHEFLDAARKDSTWQKAKDRLGDTLGGLPFELLSTVLMDLSKKAVGLSS